MVAKVSAIQEATRELADAKSDRDMRFFKNKCAALDRKIDRIVYDMYGLTEEEVQIVDAAVT
jgi:hypothetical protein